MAGASVQIHFPFIVGSVWDKTARFVEVMIDKGPDLALTPMTLRMEPLDLPGGDGKPECEPADIVFTGHCRVIVRVGRCDVGEITTSPGTVWHAHCPEPSQDRESDRVIGGQKSRNFWQLLQPHATVGFSVAAHELRKMTLSFTTPQTLKEGLTTNVRITQRKDHKIITGGVSLSLTVTGREAQTQAAVRRSRRQRGSARSKA